MNIIVFVTAKDANEAELISKKLLEDKLIACANIVKDIKSFFWWEGKIDQADEVLLVMKTKKALFGEIVQKVKALHSYDVPEVLAVPIEVGNEDYLRWVNESVR